MRRNKLLRALTALVVMMSLAAPAGAAGEESVPYPARTFLYVVDCSGSMQNYQQALNVSRQMLLDLLPEENTTVVGFKARPYTPGDTLEFGENTSVLSGILRADEILGELWEKNPKQEITVVLFSDMYSTVEAGNGTDKLTEASARTENELLAEIAGRWNDYTEAGQLRFYSLNWPLDTSGKVPDGFPMTSFTVTPAASGSANVFLLPDADEENFSQKILKLCAEVYANVLTGSAAAEWEDVGGTWADGSLTVRLGERYREFLLLNETPDQAVGPEGEPLPCWSLPGGCILMLEGGAEGTCTIEGVSSAAALKALVIPQPKLDVVFSEDPMTVFDPVTISIAATDGKNYLGYDDSNAICELEVTAPGETAPEPLPCRYDPIQNCFQVTFVPEAPGSYVFDLVYIVLGEESVPRSLSFTKEAGVNSPRPAGYRLRQYQELVQTLYDMEKGDEVAFELSSYYSDSKLRLEFVVESPENPKIAVWEPSVDAEGAVTVRGVGAGETTLRYTVRGCIDGMDEPVCLEEYELTVSIAAAPESPAPGGPAIIAVGAAAAAVGAIVLSKKRKAE